MKRIWFASAMLVLSAVTAISQEETITLDNITLDDVMQWANENLDEATLRALREVDQEKVKQLFQALQKQYQGEYVIDLASLKDAARAVLPLLEGSEDTQPYAAWLKAQLDYLEVADQFRLITPPPKSEPGQAPKPAPNPTPEKQREVWIKKVSERPLPEAAKPYVPKLKPIFVAEKVPSELVWLAEVESGFDARARSPSGAAGLFQLMPATAKHYGLRTSGISFLDQRLDSEASGRAAAKHLGYLHGRFKNWRLALAAYNAGEGTVQRLLDRYHATTFEGISTHLPAETQMYVPRVEATILRREGVRLDQLRTPDQ